MRWVPEKLPEDLDAERSLLATLCAPGAQNLALECAARLKDTDFVHPAHRVVFRGLCALLDAGQEINLLTLRDQIRTTGQENRVGGITGLTELLSCAEVGKPQSLVDILGGMRQKRELIGLASRLISGCLEDQQAPSALIELTGAELCQIAGSSSRVGLERIREFSGPVMENLQAAMEGKASRGTFMPGWPRWNAITRGFQPGALMILAARPGVGKTALALNWLHAISISSVPSVYFSLEMAKDEILGRLLSHDSGRALGPILSERDTSAFFALKQSQEHLNRLPLYVDDRSTTGLRQITAEVDRILAKEGRLGLVVIDYLQLMSTPDTKAQTETHRIAELSRGLKLLAKDRNVPVLVLSQLNREVEKRSGGKPQLSDLRDSGAIEQDADMVMFIHRADKPGMPSNGLSELIIAKHRNGPCARLDLKFTPELTRYEETSGLDYESSGTPFPAPLESLLI